MGVLSNPETKPFALGQAGHVRRARQARDANSCLQRCSAGISGRGFPCPSQQPARQAPEDTESLLGASSAPLELAGPSASTARSQRQGYSGLFLGRSHRLRQTSLM